MKILKYEYTTYFIIRQKAWNVDGLQEHCPTKKRTEQIILINRSLHAAELKGCCYLGTKYAESSVYTQYFIHGALIWK